MRVLAVTHAVAVADRQIVERSDRRLAHHLFLIFVTTFSNAKWVTTCRFCLLGPAGEEATVVSIFVVFSSAMLRGLVAEGARVIDMATL